MSRFNDWFFANNASRTLFLSFFLISPNCWFLLEINVGKGFFSVVVAAPPFPGVPEVLRVNETSIWPSYFALSLFAKTTADPSLISLTSNWDLSRFNDWFLLIMLLEHYSCLSSWFHLIVGFLLEINVGKGFFSVVVAAPPFPGVPEVLRVNETSIWPHICAVTFCKNNCWCIFNVLNI
ncbi:hypothetical protein J8A71_04255 [Mycoplasmopsis agalactiae]|uniref:hypothetical protein n=1 Tax=Mycoplasmopsis agalactiae TaxID=2110 RepID=UPI001F2AB1AB|nr:hypothetical protein [Mycoplasmopsis agalactiae]MCE6062057.1 hypothetical protein [Mycoplasmopsis agalactiae]